MGGTLRIMFSHDGTRLATFNPQGASVVDLTIENRDKIGRHIRGLPNACFSDMAFNPDGTILVTVGSDVLKQSGDSGIGGSRLELSEDAMARVWDVQTGQEFANPSHWTRGVQPGWKMVGDQQP